MVETPRMSRRESGVRGLRGELRGEKFTRQRGQDARVKNKLASRETSES